jgi:hypothetical protein
VITQMLNRFIFIWRGFQPASVSHTLGGLQRR